MNIEFSRSACHRTAVFRGKHLVNMGPSFAVGFFDACFDNVDVAVGVTLTMGEFVLKRFQYEILEVLARKDITRLPSPPKEKPIVEALVQQTPDIEKFEEVAAIFPDEEREFIVRTVRIWNSFRNMYRSQMPLDDKLRKVAQLIEYRLFLRSPLVECHLFLGNPLVWIFHPKKSKETMGLIRKFSQKTPKKLTQQQKT